MCRIPFDAPHLPSVFNAAAIGKLNIQLKSKVCNVLATFLISSGTAVNRMSYKSLAKKADSSWDEALRWSISTPGHLVRQQKWSCAWQVQSATPGLAVLGHVMQLADQFDATLGDF